MSKSKPIRRELYKRLPILRVPFDEPLTPGLRRPGLVSAIGFRPDPVERAKWDDLLGSVWQNGRRIR